MIPAQEVQDKAWKLRRDVVQMLAKAGSGHIASALGLSELFSTLYFGGVLHYDPKNPSWEGRDRLVVSNGHVCPIWYSSLARAGFFPVEELKTYSKMGSLLQGHPHLTFEYDNDKVKRIGLPGIENSGGSLGQGLSLATGMALGLKLREEKLKREYGRIQRVFCLFSDAETQEGQAWEALQVAVMQKLSNLTFIIDRNNILIDGNVDDVSPIEPLDSKLESFGLHVLEVNGHDVEAIFKIFELDLAISSGPVAIILNTIPGKGVSFMENDFEWHDKIPSPEETKKAIEEIEKHL